VYLKKSNFFNFRNIKDITLEFDKGINLFYGKNGQGKTNLLEGIYFNATGKSFRTNTISEMIKYSKTNMRVYSNFEDTINEKDIGINILNKKKEYYYNKKKISFDDYFGKLTVISFIPEDIEIIIGAPSLRRVFFDYEISQIKPEYYYKLKQFNKVLKVRNRLLKEKKSDDELFLIYTEQFIELSAFIIKERIEFTKSISVLLNLNYRKLFDMNSELKLEYKSSLKNLISLTEVDLKELMKEEIKKVNKKEKIYGYSLIGPQRDDYLFFLNERNAKHFSSQGEKKSVVFSLKISEIDLIVKNRKEYPLFLLDDISSYFDSIRKESIIDYFERKKIQTIMSSTEKVSFKANSFYVEEGMIK